jgi:tetratricopeptide (TPR) repeat protein
MQGIAILACARAFGFAGLVTFGAPAQISASPGQQINRTSATSSMAIQQPTPSLPESAAAAVDEGTRLLDGGDMEAARPQFERALVLARVEGNRQVEGRAHRGLGVILQRRANYPAAKEALERALTILEETGPTLQLASTHTALGTVEYYLKHWDATREHYLKALDAFEALGDLAEQGNLHYNLSFIAVDRDDALRSIERGVDLARKGGAAQLEGQLLHAWSDNLFARGRLAEAMKKLEPAISLLEAAGETARGRLAFALTSLGRLHRAHGHHEQALNAYRQALHIQEALGDRFGMVQSLNAIGVAFAYLGRPREARPGLERALELARGTGSPSLIDFVTVSLATILIRTGDSARGVEMLEQIVARDSTNHDVFKQLANGYLDTGRYARAIESATSAIVKAREQGQLDQIQDTLEIRARAREQLAQHAEALADTREAIAHIERVRTDLIPTDAMKRGFSGEHQALFTLAIGLLNRLGRGREALDVAEQARGRAFADLLASRETVLSAAARREEGAPSTRVTRGADSRSDGLVRGGEAGASPPVAALHSDRDLRSFASAAPLYVIRLDAASRRVVVGPRAALRMDRIRLRDVNWIGDGALECVIGEGIELFVRVRSTRAPQPAWLRAVDGTYEVELVAGEEGVSPGQACVFYDAPSGQARVLGGGFIKSATARNTAARGGVHAIIAPPLVEVMRG